MSATWTGTQGRVDDRAEYSLEDDLEEEELYEEYELDDHGSAPAVCQGSGPAGGVTADRAGGYGKR